MVVLRCVAAGLMLTLAAAAARFEAAHAARTAPCPVTIPTRTADDSFGPSGFNYGHTRLRAALSWPRGTLPAGMLPDGGSYATVLDDGTIRTKMGWWRGLAGKLVITGRRLDAAAPALRARAAPTGYGATGFVPSELIFPTVGCWRVTGRLGPARLTFVVRVTKLRRQL